MEAGTATQDEYLRAFAIARAAAVHAALDNDPTDAALEAAYEAQAATQDMAPVRAVAQQALRTSPKTVLTRDELRSLRRTITERRQR